ncbi:Glycerophosphodiester phosphodiesterase GDE1 [Smittium mucronatum]|uniref:Glycerophosphodiester phosphodiesterase GDE1 n=1 Tax=Smittium mucronatum TaxID=133383 RepID=A0A1R0GRW9_9FUNG|nr:Glycerophosphodiester phosphodiesterase GDE1 [Smittium mucronatum]
MQQAAKSGSDFVEFDVQLTSDSVPVIYHDWSAAETGVNCKIDELKEKEFLGMKNFGRVNETNGLKRRNSMKESSILKGKNRDQGNRYKGNSSLVICDKFTNFSELLENLPVEVGIDIEIKYPLADEAKYFGLKKAFEINWYVDKILDVLVTHLENLVDKKRRVIISSFHPDILFLLSQKLGNLVPLYFLTDGGCSGYVLQNHACNGLSAAIQLSKKYNLSGIICQCKLFSSNPVLIRLIKGAGLLVSSYGSLNNSEQSVKVQIENGIDMIIAVSTTSHISVFSNCSILFSAPYLKDDVQLALQVVANS